MDGTHRHKEHFVCIVCATSLLGQQYHEHEGSPYCHEDFMDTFAHRCAGCKDPVFGAHLTALGKHWHVDCFVCTTCKDPFEAGKYFTHANKPYCSTHYHDKVGKRCAGCGAVITENHVSALGASWHATCFNCTACGTNLTGTLFAARKSKPMCKTCAVSSTRSQSSRVSETLSEIKAQDVETACVPHLDPQGASAARNMGKAFALAVRPILTSIAASDVPGIKAKIAATISPVKDIINAVKTADPRISGGADHVSTLQSHATQVLTQAKAVFASTSDTLPGALALLKRFLINLTGDVNNVLNAVAPSSVASQAASTSSSASTPSTPATPPSTQSPERLSLSDAASSAPSVKSMLDQQLKSFLVEIAELCIYLTQAGAEQDDYLREEEGVDDGSSADPKAVVLVKRVLRSMTSISSTIEVLDNVDWTGPQRLAQDLTSAAQDGRAVVRSSAERMGSVQRVSSELKELVTSIVTPYLDGDEADGEEEVVVAGPMGLNHRLESFGVGRAGRGSHSRFIQDWQDPTKFEPSKVTKHAPRRAQTMDLSRLELDFDSPAGLAAANALTAGGGGAAAASSSSNTSPPVSPHMPTPEALEKLRKARARPLPSANSPSTMDAVPDSKRNKSGRRRAQSMSLSLLTTARLSSSLESVTESIKPFELELPTPEKSVETQERSRVLDIQRLMGDLGDIFESEDLAEVAYVTSSLESDEAELSSESNDSGAGVATAVPAVATLTVNTSSPASEIQAKEVVLLPRSKRENVQERLVDEDVAQLGSSYLPGAAAGGEAGVDGADVAGASSASSSRTRAGSTIGPDGNVELHPPVSGKLTLKRGMFNKWKRRHFLLENCVLYFMKLNGRTVIDRLPVPGCEVSGEPETSHDFAFSLTTTEVMGSDVVIFRAENDEDRARWVSALQEVSGMSPSLLNEATMRPVQKKQSRMTIRKGKSFSLAAGLAAAGIEPVSLVKRKAILDPAGTEVLVYINNKVEAGTPEKLISLLVSESDPPPGYETVFLMCFRHALKPKFVLESLMGRFNCVAPPNATEQQLAYVQTWRPIIQTRVIDFVEHWVEHNWYDFHDDEVMVVGIMNFVALINQAGDSEEIRGRSEGLDKAIEAKIKEYDQYKEAVLEEPRSGAVAHEWGKLVDFDPVDLARNYTLMEMDMFRAVRPEEFTVQMWGDKSKGFLRVFSENLSAFVDSFNHISYWVASEICLTPILKKRTAILKHIILLGKEFFEHRNFNGLMAVISGLNLASVQRLKKTWRGLSSKILGTLHQLEEVMSPKSNYQNYRTLLSEKPAVPFFGLLLKDLTFLDDGNPKRIEGTALINYDKWRTISRAILEICSFQDSVFDFEAEGECTEYLSSCLVLEDSPLYKYSLLCEPRGASEDSDSQRLIEKWAS